MAKKVDKDFLADANARLKTDYKSINEYLTNKGKFKKDGEGYNRRLAALQNFRGTEERRQIVLSGRLLEEAKKLYGSAADMYNIPELKPLFEDAFVNQWTANELLRAIDNTDWARSRTAAQEAYDILRTTNPVQADAQIESAIPTVRRVLTEKGIALGEDQIRQIAEKGARSGWQGQQWDEFSASEAISLSTRGMAPTAQPQAQPVSAVSATQLRKIAKDFGVPLADTTLNQWVNDIATNRRNQDQFTEYARASAQTLYPGLAERLKTNTFDEITSPYKRLYADILETPEDNVDLSSPQFSNLFMAGDPNSPRMMTSTEWAAFLRKRPEWQNTRGAYREYSEAASTLNKIFGGVR